MKAREFFESLGPNFMTPHVIKYVDTDKYLIELSEGEGFTRNKIYGVTVVGVNGERDPTGELSNMFHSRKEAEDWIAELKRR